MYGIIILGWRDIVRLLIDIVIIYWDGSLNILWSR